MTDLLAAEPECAFVRRKSPRNHIDQGRLASTILAEEDMQFTGSDIEVDPIQSQDTREPFRNAPQFEQGLGPLQVRVGVHLLLRIRSVARREKRVSRPAPARLFWAYLALTE